MGRWLSRWTAGTTLRSSVLRVCSAKVRTPRSHSTTVWLPSVITYSEAESLKRIERGSRLIRAATEEPGASLLHHGSHSECLLATLDRARSGHDGEIASADRARTEIDDRVVFLQIAGDKLVGLGDAD